MWINGVSKRVILPVTLLALFAVSVLFIQSTSRNRSKVVLEPEYRYYTFDPATILELLAGTDTDVFEQQNNEFVPTPFEPARTVEWSQKDYLRIAGAIHEQFWRENIESWNLHFMMFVTECEHFDKGPQQAVFRYYAVPDPALGRAGYDETINIDPSTNSILLRYAGLDTRSEYSSAIDLARVKISIQDALRIGEDDGGREAKLQAKNACWVDAVLSPYERNRGWNMFYYDNNRNKLLEINIDDASGEAEILWPLTQ